MSIGATYTRPHAFNALDPRSGPQIFEEALERTQDAADLRDLDRRRAVQAALRAAVMDFPPMDVYGLLVRRAGFTVELGCSAPDVWHAHHTPVDGDGFPTDDDSHFGSGRTAEEALAACVRQAEEASCG